MRPLVTQQRVLTWFCLCPAPDGTSKFLKLKYILMCGILMLNQSICLLSCSAYFFKFLSTNLRESLFALFSMAANLSVLYQMIIALFSQHKILDVIESLSDIYDANENEDTFQFLVETNETCEWIWKFYYKFVICGFAVCTSIVSLLSFVFCLLINDHFYSRYVYHPFRHLLPWNETPLGYLGVILYDISVADVFLIGNGLLMLLFISMCLHHQAFFKMFQHSTRKLNSPDKNRNNEQIICKLIRFHISVKKWFLNTAEVYSLIVFVILVCSMIISSCVIFQMELEIKNPDFDIIIIFIVIFVGISTLFSYCYYGKLATESFLNIGDCLFDANWQSLPVQLQKYFVIMIADAQRELYYHGFEVAILNLITFNKFMRTIFSYYMMFRTLNE